MQVSTIVDGTIIYGTVVRHTPLFIEVEINSPITKISTRRWLASERKAQRVLSNDEIMVMSEKMLNELFQLGKGLIRNSVIDLHNNKESMLQLAS